MWTAVVLVCMGCAVSLVHAQIQPRAVGRTVQVVPVPELNSSADDFVTGFARGGQEAYLTSSRTGNRQRLYRVSYEQGRWSEPERLGGALSDATHAGAATLTIDGNLMVFAAFQHELGGQGRTDLYIAERHGRRWTVRNIGAGVNSSYWDSQPCLSADGELLIFTSDRPGGSGGTDLWMSRRQGSGWSAPMPLSRLNTAADEMAPVLAPDGRTLYFASNRDGNFDIFVSRMQADGSFGRAEKLAAPVNTSADEFFFVPIPGEDAALLSRATAAGDLDVFRVVPNPEPPEPVLMVRGTVLDARSNAPLGGAVITITDLRTRRKLAELYSDEETGQYYVALPSGRSYSITASREGYLFYSERFDVGRDLRENPLTKDILLTPIEGGRTRLLVFFDFDKAELKEESFPELDRLVELLRAYPNLRVLIEGHTDDVGTDEYNDRLSQRRADAVKQYLVQNGIAAQRIETKGWGRRKPLVRGTTEEARAQNRRVEIQLLP